MTRFENLVDTGGKSRTLLTPSLRQASESMAIANHSFFFAYACLTSTFRVKRNCEKEASVKLP